MRTGLLFVTAAALLSASLAAHADALYTYTGQDFTSASGVYLPTDSVSGSFSVASPLGDDLSEEFISPETFSFSDGFQTLTDMNSVLMAFAISTDGSGEIVDWDIALQSPSGGVIFVDGGPEFGNGDTAISFGSAGNNVAGSFSGPFVSSATPEPSSLLLLGTSILGFAGVMRRKIVYTGKLSRPQGMAACGRRRPWGEKEESPHEV